MIEEWVGKLCLYVRAQYSSGEWQTTRTLAQTTLNERKTQSARGDSLCKVLKSQQNSPGLLEIRRLVLLGGWTVTGLAKRVASGGGGKLCFMIRVLIPQACSLYQSHQAVLGLVQLFWRNVLVKLTPIFTFFLNIFVTTIQKIQTKERLSTLNISRMILGFSSICSDVLSRASFR